MEFYFLGTGSGLPSTTRNVTSIAVRFLQKKSTQWLFDCGEATQHQLLETPITLSKIDRIFITHLHGDHIFGLPGFITSRAAQGATSPLYIYGPSGLQSFIENVLSVSQSHICYPLHFVVVEPGIVFKDDTITVEAMEADHSIQGFSYKLIEADQPGTLQAERLKQEGIPPGPIYERIKRGETIELSCGRIIHGNDYVGKRKKGRVVVLSGDTRPMNKMKTFAKEANVLIHEGTFLHEMKKEADQFGHSTIKDAAYIAKQAKVDTLIVTHISSRYTNEENRLEQEATAIFPHTYIAYDLMKFTVR